MFVFGCEVLKRFEKRFKSYQKKKELSRIEQSKSSTTAIMPTASFQSQLGAVLRMTMKRKWRHQAATLVELGFPFLMAVMVTLIIRFAAFADRPISDLGKHEKGLR